MSGDIVERLRARYVHPHFYDSIFNDAAAEITNLRAANAALKQMVSDKDALLTALRTERDDAARGVVTLRKLIDDFLTGNYGPTIASQSVKCPHGSFANEECEACADEHFERGLVVFATEGNSNG